jgi:hypothetical protein
MAKKSGKSPASLPSKTENPKKIDTLPSKKAVTTQVVVRHDCGFANSLYIRGEGISTLSWDKGVQMKNVAADQWVWTSDRPCSTIQFKIILNDTKYEQGENHSVAFGQRAEIEPKF